MQKKEITVTLLNREFILGAYKATGCGRAASGWTPAFTSGTIRMDSGDPQTVLASKHIAMALVHGSGNHVYCWFSCLPAPLKLVEPFQEKASISRLYWVAARQQPNMQLLLCAATWCNLSHTQKLMCEATIGGGCTLGRMACMLSEIMP